jgi:hypothetical protein
MAVKHTDGNDARIPANLLKIVYNRDTDAHQPPILGRRRIVNQAAEMLELFGDVEALERPVSVENKNRPGQREKFTAMDASLAAASMDGHEYHWRIVSFINYTVLICGLLLWGV